MVSLFIDTSSSDVSIAIVKDNQILSNINKNIVLITDEESAKAILKQ